MIIKKAVNYSTSFLPPKACQTTQLCLDLIQFSMFSTFVTFQDNYFEYKGQGRDPDNQGLTIGRYESAFCADLVASRILEKCQ